MTKRLKWAIAAAALAVTSAGAAEPSGMVLDNGKSLILLHHKPGAYTPPLAHKSKTPALFENFASFYPKGVYNASTGASLSGPVTIHGQIWLAAAFKPAVDATVKEVDVAAGFINGSKNLVQVHLYADANGVPGAELWARSTALPAFQDCCAIVMLKDREQVHVTAGQQYWIGITTLPGAKDVAAAWDLSVADQVDPGVNAQDRGSGWQAGSALPNFAFGVYGN